MIKNYFKLIVALVFVSNVMAQNVPSYVPTNGLVGWWPFNGNANELIGLTTPSTNTATLDKDRFNIGNQAYRFNGNNVIKFLGDNALSKVGNNFNDWTINFWINPTTLNTNSAVILGSFGWGYGISLRNNNQINISYIKTGGGSEYSTISTIQINKWSMISLVKSSTSIKVFIDNQLNIEFNNVNNIATYNKNNSWFGANGQDNVDYYNGLIDDISIHNRALTQQEINALYTGNTQSALASTKVFVDAPATVNQNQEVELSISTEALNTSDNVIAYQTDFSYDTTRYTYVGNNLTGTLNPSGNAVVNSSKNGKLAISYMSQTALSGAGSLVKLKFKANNTLGQGIFGLSNFLYNTTAVTSLKNDTVNTIDVTPPTAKITYSQNPVRKGDSLLITVNFNEKMAVSPVPQLNLTGQNTLANMNLTKVNDTTYTHWWVVEKGNGAVNVNLATGKDLGGNVIVSTPTQNPSFTVLPTLFGDIDTNKLVQAYDAALALQYSVGLNPLPTMDPLPWSNWRLAVANVDTVGNVTANDASLILQHSAKLISTFPADAKKRGGDAPTANVTVTQEGNKLVFRASGTLYAFNVFMKDNFNVFGQPEVKDKSAMVASNLNTSTYNVGLASTTPFVENEPFLVIPILTNENVQGAMDIVANTEEKSLSYGKAAGIASINKEVVLVYPNPTKDVVTINNAQGKTLRIVDVQGKEVYNQKVTTSTMELSMKTLGSKGMYVLHIVDANNESVQTKQIVLE